MNLKTIASFALIASLSVSCVGKFVGGGHIPGAADQNKKATFGFNAQAEDTNDDGQSDTYKGQFQYKDHSNGVTFHGTITSANIVEPPNLPAPTAFISGQTSNGGIFSATVTDNGTPGMSAGDTLSVVVLFDPLIGFYFNNGTIGGGNVTYIPE